MESTANSLVVEIEGLLKKRTSNPPEADRHRTSSIEYLMEKNMDDNNPEEKIREVVDACSDCDVCRHLMDADCLFFPQLYRLIDNESETGKQISAGALRDLVDLCNFCALCPCPNIRADIIEAKTRFIDRDGLPFNIRTIEDVERIGKICGSFPRLINNLLGHRSTGSLIKRAAGIHADRVFPEIPTENFVNWARKRQLHLKRNPGRRKKVAYFAGCTGRHLFPDVPKAAVAVLEANDIEVFYPQQKCCGMPTLLEGDRDKTLEFAEFNLRHLTGAVKDGYDIVCSCPTCGFFFKNILKEGAYYSAEYQSAAGGGENIMKLPAGKDLIDGHKTDGFVELNKSIYGKILKDAGYFSTLSPQDRIRAAEHTFDLGEYLTGLHQTGKLKIPAAPAADRLVYFPPCHGREQRIGRPYPELLRTIEGIDLETIAGNFYCCGMAGIMGFKQDFHEASKQLGQRLMQKIRDLKPDRIVTDCLSCRLQFQQLLPYPVSHPVEILKDAYVASNMTLSI